MPPARGEYLQKRLANEGLTPDQIASYIDALRQFLTAKLTKVAFEDAMAKVLPRDKYSVHNAIILEILQRCHQKREGLPDIPVIQPLKDKKIAANSSHSKLPSTSTPKLENSIVPQRGVKRPNGAVDRKVPKQASPKRPKIAGQGADEDTPLAIPPSEIPTYDTLSFQPAKPGQAIDVELFMKIRRRMAHNVQKFGLTGGVKDEAVALLTHSLERHIKNILESAVNCRIAREHGVRPEQYRRTNAVTPTDLREGMVRDVGALGNDPSEAFERLLLLL